MHLHKTVKIFKNGTKDIACRFDVVVIMSWYFRDILTTGRKFVFKSIPEENIQIKKKIFWQT